MSYTIKKLSSTGFLLDDGWKSCDKFKVLVKPIFFNLKVGDKIDNIKYHKGKDDKMYVVDFTVLNHEDQGEEGTSQEITSQVTHGSESLTLPSCATKGEFVLERDGKVLNPQQSKDLFISKPSVQDSIRYAQCVNIAFNTIQYNQYTSDESYIQSAFDFADDLFKEFNNRVGGN